MFIYLFLWEHAHVSRGEAERGRERNRAVSTEPDAGLNLTNHEIMTWAKIKSRMHNKLNHPGAPSRFHTGRAGPDVGLNATNDEIMAWAEIKSRMLNWLSHPGTLFLFYLGFDVWEIENSKLSAVDRQGSTVLCAEKLLGVSKKDQEHSRAIYKQQQ